MSCHSSSSSTPVVESTDSSPFSSASSTPASESSSSFTDSPAEGEGHACCLAIAALPESELRALVAKLAMDPSFQRAIARELHLGTRSKGRGRHSQQSAPPDAVCANCQKVCRDTAPNGHCTFHPGHLQNDVYEFVSRTPVGHKLKTRQTLAMWTCCAEDPHMPGCTDAATHLWRTE
ncbi:hypothetical protein B0H11DRAFT_1192291 [Mycena galericulata]|nr:hypothetical protein B0H11DRAFT_1192291 [Mycena galericulata]